MRIQLFMWMNAVDYPYIISGKPYFSLPAFIPVTFETTILFSAFTTLFGLFAIIGLPRWNHPIFTSKRFGRFSDDGFIICIEARDAKFTAAGTKAFLEQLGGKHIELVEDDI